MTSVAARFASLYANEALNAQKQHDAEITNADTLHHLRRLTRSCLAKFAWKNAAFYADKACSFSQRKMPDASRVDRH